MSQHTAVIEWQRGDQPFSDNKYSRAHNWTFDGGAVVRGSSTPSAMIPPPLSDETAVDPEEALVAAVSSCHMMFFLAYARKDGLVVDSYRDAAEGTLGKDERGKMSITDIVLRPAVSWSGDTVPDAVQILDLHHRAHEACYIGNSVRSTVTVEPQ
ncbi:OsmC family protein [Brevundimonas terrae]|uniref:OsmC family protein n=1 Tax=Brevundimonas terrae TaxID=363631 RepID=A0ABN0Y1T5_9CAUL|nr:OsmC family protein [Brevundimonas terrae]NIJ26033.1 organic hydroperoxide reductase OsmC/OhrA [Brevundimonas terrae]